MEYYKGLVTYFDVLGFSEQIRTKDCGQIHKVLDVFSYHSVEDTNGEEEDCLKTFIFSDCVVRFVDLNTKFYPANNPFLELINLIRIQGELINQGIVIRGGITYGEFYFDSKKHFIYGPGIVRAVALEKLAKFPRIVVDSYILKLVESNASFKMPHHTSEYELQQVKSVLRTEDQVYLNYFKVFQDEVDDIESYGVWMDKHRSLILNGLLSEDISTREKYQWLKKYHNEIVSEYGLEQYICNYLD